MCFSLCRRQRSPMPYRRRLKSDTVHWCPTCRWYPTDAQVASGEAKEQDEPSDDLCNFCRAHEKAGKCQRPA